MGMEPEYPGSSGMISIAHVPSATNIDSNHISADFGDISIDGTQENQWATDNGLLATEDPPGHVSVKGFITA